MKRKLSLRWRAAAGSMLVAVVAVGILTAVAAPASAALGRSDVAVAHNADGRLEMFFVDQAQRVWDRRQITASSQSWSSWSRFDDNRPFFSVAAETGSDGRIEVFARDGNGGLYRKRQAAQNSGQWSAWELIDGSRRLDTRGLSVTRGPQGAMTVFGIIGGDIYGKTQFTATTWSAWTRVPENGSVWFAGVAAETKTSGRMELFAVTNLRDAFHATEVSPGTGTFSSWRYMGAEDLLSIAVTKGPWGGMVVFGTDSPGNIWGITQYTATTWSPWGPIAGTLTQVAADINVDQRLTLVGVHDGELGRAHTNLETGVNVGTYSGWVRSNVPGDFPTQPPTTTSAPPTGPQPATVTLVRQIVTEGPIPYLGRFPAFGQVLPGRLTQIHVPQVGFTDIAVLFVKPGRSTQQCNDPTAVVRIGEGQTTTAAQINQIFGVAQPPFSTLSPLNFVACVVSPALLNNVNIVITVVFD